MKEMFVFDLDGTIAASKAPVDHEMANLFASLLDIGKAAVISGGDWPQFEKQVISRLPPGANLKNLFILPTCGTKFFAYKGSWKAVYEDDLTAEQRNKIIQSLEHVVDNSGFKAEKTWGEPIEDRLSQITYSALGQKAPLEEKEKWDPKFAKRKKMKAQLDKLLPEFTVRLGGTTSIDITKHGVDKAYGIRKLRDILKIPIDNMVFVGDALFPGGNDHAARKTGVVCIQVRDPDETKRVIEAIIACVQPERPSKK